MNTAEILHIGSIGCLTLAAIFMIISVILFVRLQIWSTIYDLTGKKRASELKKMQNTYNVTGSLNGNQAAVPSKDLGAPSEQEQGLFNTAQMPKAAIPTEDTDNSGRMETTAMRKTAPKQNNTAAGGMTITKKVVMIHTDEKIR